MECFNNSLKLYLTIYDSRSLLGISKTRYPNHDYDFIQMVYNENVICSDKDWIQKWDHKIESKKYKYKQLDTSKLETNPEELLLGILNSGYDEYSCYDGTKYSKKDVVKLGSSKFITLDLIEKYWGIPWNYEEISKNPNLTEDFVLKYIEKFKYDIDIDRDIKLISIPCLSIKFIIEHENLFDLYNISNRTCLTVDDVLTNHDIYWDWDILCKNPSFNIKELKVNP